MLARIGGNRAGVDVEEDDITVARSADRSGDLALCLERPDLIGGQMERGGGPAYTVGVAMRNVLWSEKYTSVSSEEEEEEEERTETR
ncbi:uncharacterized [Tachysurus ichikawai]